MIIGVPKEIKNHEYRVGMTPASVRELCTYGHRILVQQNAGVGIGFNDDDYRLAGAEIIEQAKDIFKLANLIVKVKEPQAEECKMLHEGQTIFTYLHLAPDPNQAELLLKSGCAAIAYETVTDTFGHLPLLSPMSEVAGRMSIQAGAHCLEKAQGGLGVLLAGVPGVMPGHVVILGGGVVGSNAARVAMGMGAKVTVFDRSLPRLRQLDAQFGGAVTCLYPTTEMMLQHVIQAELVIGAVLVPGASAPRLITREHLAMMRPGTVVVDVSIDQGGCFESSKPTTHAVPTYVDTGVVHYCVANMPGAVPRTSTFALNSATLPFILELANKGTKTALVDNVHLRHGLNVHAGHITHPAVAENLNLNYVPVLDSIDAA